MLPKILLGSGMAYRGLEDEEWLKYLSRIGDYAQILDHRFLSEMCYEHGRRFNDYFPGFDLNVHKIKTRLVTASETREFVRYDYNEPATFWALQFDNYRAKPQPFKYLIFEHMIKNGTWPFPPVIIDNSNGFAGNLSKRSLGLPWHLIEGTHRVSYLNRMLELNLVAPASEHEIFWLCE